MNNQRLQEPLIDKNQRSSLDDRGEYDGIEYAELNQNRGGSSKQSNRGGPSGYSGPGAGAPVRAGQFSNRECNDGTCQFLKENVNCIEIPKMDTEITEYKKLVDPTSIYLMYCKKYSNRYLIKNEETVPLYKFKRADFINRVMSPKIIDFLRLNDPQKPLDNDSKIEKLFKTDNDQMKIFTNLLFHDDRQILMVKTWQKVSMTLKNKNIRIDETYIKNFMNEQKYELDKKWKYVSCPDSLNTSNTQSTAKNQRPSRDNAQRESFVSFYIKTMQFFNFDVDKHTIKPINDNPILVEQCFGQFMEFRMYDADFLKYNGKVYYFKRIFKGDPNSIQSALKGSKSGHLAAGEGYNGIKSSLQLFAFDLSEGREQLVKDFCHEERYERPPPQIDQRADDDQFARQPDGQSDISDDEYDDQAIDQFTKLEEIALLISNFDMFKTVIQYNVTFSKPFGPIASQEQHCKDDMEFLKTQYYTYQQYVLSNALNPIKIYQLGAKNEEQGRLIVNTALHPKNDDHQRDMKDMADRNCQTNKEYNRQVQYINHYQEYVHKVPTGAITFVIQNMFAMVQIVIDTARKKAQQDTEWSVQTYQRQATDLFQKLWYNNGIQVFKVKIEQQKEMNQSILGDQYFFYDNRNQIQVLWPNYGFKVDRLKCQELIAGKTGNKISNFTESKKIVCICQENDSDTPHEKIVFQKFKNLKNILDLKTDKIPESNQMTFCCDNKNNQILYIMDTWSGKIQILQMRESECVTCQCVNNSELMLSSKSEAFIKAKKKNQIRALMKSSDCSEDKAQNIWTEKVKNRIDQSMQKYLHQIPTHDTSNCNICEEDVEIQYTSYQDMGAANVNKAKSKLQNIPVISLEAKEKKNHVFIDDVDGTKRKIKTFEDVKGQGHKKKNEEVKLIYHQHAQDHQVFIFQVSNKPNTDKQNNDNNDDLINTDKKETKRSYIFIRKKHSEMEEIISSQCNTPLIKDRENEDKIQILKANKKLHPIKFGCIKEYQFKDDDNVDDLESNGSDNLSPVRNKEQAPQDDIKYVDIKLGINKITQDHTQINFIPLVYQECQNYVNNKLLVYDILGEKFATQISINHGMNSAKYIYQDDQGFNCFTMCRVSDVYEADAKTKKGPKKQWAKYQLFTLFSEKLGRFSCSEYLITHDEKGITLQTIGQKDVLLSNKIINSYDWIHIKNSQAVPFYDDCGSIKGSQLVLKLGPDLFSTIDLTDQDRNTIYKYQSDIIFTGRRKFIIQKGHGNEANADKFIMVASTQFRAQYIEKNIFTPSESYKVLRQTNLLTIGMRSTNLRYLIMNDFEDIKGKDFFRCQELLLGKSVMDVCLSDTQAIQEALKHFVKDSDDLGGSLLDEITANDKSRKDSLKEINLYPKTMLLNLDYNHVGTIERAIQQKSFKSLNALVEYFFEMINTFDYYHMFMHDLDTILLQENRQIEINQFFNSQFAQLQDSQQQACTVEIKFKNNIDLPVFSNKKEDYIKNTEEFEDFQNYEQEVSKMIKAKEGEEPKGCLNALANLFKSGDEETYEVEHRYIDFQSLIIGQKIKKFDTKVHELKFNDIFYSKFMLNYTNLEFYQMDSVQKFIDFHWSQTQLIMKSLFHMYMYLFLIPVTINLFSQDEHLHKYMMNVAMFPMVVLTFIEIVQLKAQRWNYFQGWNCLDVAQILVFFSLQIMRWLGVKEEEEIYISELQLLQIVLAFSKLGYFIKVYENYGFLIFMLVECCIALSPFIMTYIILIFYFSIFYIVLNFEIDPEVRDAQALTYFPKMLIQVARTSFGELAMPMYRSLLKREDSTFKNINLILIWLFWFMQVFFILVIMTNFLIAVITTTFDGVMNRQKIVSYQQKAEINAECFLLKEIFCEMPSYNIVVLSTGKEASTLMKNPLKELSQKLKQFLTKEIGKIKATQDKLAKNMKGVFDGQKNLENQFKRGFDTILENQQNLKQALMNKLNK